MKNKTNTLKTIEKQFTLDKSIKSTYPRGVLEYPTLKASYVTHLKLMTANAFIDSKLVPMQILTYGLRPKEQISFI